MATISNSFNSNFVSSIAKDATKFNVDFVEGIRKAAGKSLAFINVKMNIVPEGEQTVRRVFSTGEFVDLTAAQFVTVGLQGSDGDIIETSVLRWWNETLTLATLGAAENLMHEYSPFANSEFGSLLFAKTVLPKRGTVIIFHIDLFQGADTIKEIKVGPFVIRDLKQPPTSEWTDDDNKKHYCQWFGIKMLTNTMYTVFGIGADNAERDVLLTTPTLKNIRFGREYMNRMFSQMRNLVEGKRYRMTIAAIERTGHRSDGAEFQFTDYAEIYDAISTVNRSGMTREEALLDRQAAARQAAVVRKVDMVYSRAEKNEEIKRSVTVADNGVAKAVFTDTRPLENDVDKAKSLEYIRVDFGSGVELTSINDARLTGYFTPCHFVAGSLKPVAGSKLYRSSRDIRAARISGYALKKA
jgi:hypothetical protein